MENQVKLYDGFLEVLTYGKNTWKWRNLVLTNNRLEGYKAKKQLVFTIELEDIAEKIPYRKGDKKYCFGLRFGGKYIFMSSYRLKEMHQWHCVMEKWLALSRPSFVELNDVLINEKLYKEMALIMMFNGLKAVLAEREAELLAEYTRLHEMTIKDIDNTIENCSLVLREKEQLYKEFEEKINGTFDTLSRIRIASSAKKPTGLANCPVVNETQLRVNINCADLPNLVRKNSSVISKDGRERSIKRSEQIWILKWAYHSNRYDAVSFSVNHPVSLTAVSVNGPYKFNRYLCINHLYIIRGDSTSSRKIYEHSHQVFIESSGTPVIRVNLNTPVYIGKGVHTLLMQIYGSKTFKCKTCKSEVTNPVDGVIWKFFDTRFDAPGITTNRTDSKAGCFPEFFYTKSDSN